MINLDGISAQPATGHDGCVTNIDGTTKRLYHQALDQLGSALTFRAWSVSMSLTFGLVLVALNEPMQPAKRVVAKSSIEAFDVGALGGCAGKLNDGFTIRDLYRKDWHLLTDGNAAQNACDELIAQSWLQQRVTPAAFGQKEEITYLINPHVRTQ